MRPIYEGLFQLDSDTLFWQPSIAKNYSISPDKLSVTVDLDPEARGTNSAIINSLRFIGYSLVGPFYLFLGIPLIYYLVFVFDLITIGVILILNKMKNKNIV